MGKTWDSKDTRSGLPPKLIRFAKEPKEQGLLRQHTRTVAYSTLHLLSPKQPCVAVRMKDASTHLKRVLPEVRFCLLASLVDCIF